MKRTATVLFLLLLAGPASAGIVTDVRIGDEFLEVEYFTGAGVKTSYVVVDFAATGGETHAFGYHYDVAPLAHDALQAIASNGAFEYDFSLFAIGGVDVPFVDNFGFSADVGDPGIFWSYSIGGYSAASYSIDWSDAPTGAGERLLSDGSFDGWYNGFTPSFGSTPPAVPTSARALPEPSTFVLGGMVLILFLVWGRHRRRSFSCL